MESWMDSRAHELTGLMDLWIYGFMDRLTDLLTLGLMDSWIDSRTHGLTDSWIHGWTPTSNDLSRIFLNCFNHRTKAFKINISPVLFVFRVKEVGMWTRCDVSTAQQANPWAAPSLWALYGSIQYFYAGLFYRNGTMIFIIIAHKPSLNVIFLRTERLIHSKLFNFMAGI